MRLIAGIFPLYLVLGLTLSDNWHKNIVIGTIAIVVARQNMFIWISCAWLYRGTLASACAKDTLIFSLNKVSRLSYQAGVGRCLLWKINKADSARESQNRL